MRNRKLSILVSKRSQLLQVEVGERGEIEEGTSLPKGSWYDEE